MSRKIELTNADEAVELYRSGTSLLELSKRTGVGRGPLARILREHGVEIRGSADSERLKWDRKRTDPNYRAIVERQCGAAWTAARGRRRSMRERVTSAKSMEQRIRGRGGMWEIELFDLIRSRLPGIVWQKAVGPYSVDLGLEERRVAVELQRQFPRTSDSSRWCSFSRERLKHLADGGWTVLVIFCPPKWKWRGHEKFGRYEAIDIRKVADYVVAFCEITRPAPPGTRHYRVIDGYAKPRAALRREFNGWTHVEGPDGGLD